MAAEPAPFPSHSVLVVDDEAAIRFAIELALRKSGWNVTAAAGGEEAIDAFRQHPGGFDVVLLDMTLPGLSSEATLEAIRRIRGDVPAVLSSGLDRETLESRIQRMNACSFLPKPFRPGQLLECLQYAVRQGEGT